MSSSTLNTLSWEEALQQIIAWNDIRGDLNVVTNTFFPGEGDSFLIGPDFDHEQFKGDAHAYFGVIMDPVKGTPQQFNLLFIPEEQDSPDYEEPYIYCAPFQPNLTEARGEGSEDVLALEERWASHGQHWLEEVVNHGEGLTQVSQVPQYDINTKFNSTHELFIYLGLHNHPNPHKRLCLLFYDAGSGTFYNLDGADFTTPKPPFGTSKADYGLVEAIPEN